MRVSSSQHTTKVPPFSIATSGRRCSSRGLAATTISPPTGNPPALKRWANTPLPSASGPCQATTKPTSLASMAGKLWLPAVVALTSTSPVIAPPRAS